MSRRFRSHIILTASVISACSFSASVGLDDGGAGGEGGPGDGGSADAAIPDAGVCPSVGTAMCVDNVLRACTAAGQLPTDTVCGWGCRTDGAGPHCGRLQPSGGSLVEADLLPEAGLEDKTLNSTGITFNTDNGSITNYRGSGNGIQNGIEFSLANGVGIFKFRRLTINGAPVSFRGANAVALVSETTMDLNAVLDVRGDCAGGSAGPSGRAGGSPS
nr:hypothetical protein [Deltaproteobacteria bacterium]